VLLSSKEKTKGERMKCGRLEYTYELTTERKSKMDERLSIVIRNDTRLPVGYEEYAGQLAEVVERSSNGDVEVETHDHKRITLPSSVCTGLSNPLPENFPVPAFTLGQEVYLKDSDNEHGTIIGMKYITTTPLKSVPQSWYYAVYRPLPGSHDDWYEEDQLSLEPWPEEEVAD